jgi:hypothetical protein
MSPIFGLKGNVDASIQARIITETKTKDTPRTISILDDRNWTLPLEIKTGRKAGEVEHRGQTMLYTLLLAERYGRFFF